MNIMLQELNYRHELEDKMKMKQGLFSLILVFFVLIFQVVLIANMVKAEECLSYEPVKVKLTGTMVEKVFPGPPEFESVEKGDEAEVVWVLVVKKPVCVKGEPNDDINADEKNIKDIQLAFYKENAKVQYKNLVDKEVIVEGELFHRITGYHYTKMLLLVDSMKSVK